MHVFHKFGCILNILYSAPGKDLTTMTHTVQDSYAVSLSLYLALDLVLEVVEVLVVIVIVYKVVFRIVTAYQIVVPCRFAAVCQVVTVYHQPPLVFLEDLDFQVCGAVLVV